MDGETCAFQFSLWDETTQVDGTLDRDLAVSEGRFTVMLDFGDVFDGTALDLQIAAQCPGDADFITLAPRQALTAGTGITLTDTEFATDTAYLQRRVSQTCASGSSIREIASDGTVVCYSDQDTLYSAGFGLLLNGTQFTVLTDTVQARVSGVCGAGYAVREIHSDGSVTCEPIPLVAADITAVYAGAGLTGGGESDAVTLTVAFSGTSALDWVTRSDHDHDGVYTLVGHTHTGDEITTAVMTATYATTATYALVAGDTDTLDGQRWELLPDPRERRMCDR